VGVGGGWTAVALLAQRGMRMGLLERDGRRGVLQTNREEVIWMETGMEFDASFTEIASRVEKLTEELIFTAEE
jgi:hypothetical protein